MGYTYASVGASQMYLTKYWSLRVGDVIWVVEGDLKKPKGFHLADCFQCASTEYPPFPPGYGKFKLKVLGCSSFLVREIALDKTELWFDILHSKYITKQRFFSSLSFEPTILAGLCDISGIKF